MQWKLRFPHAIISLALVAVVAGLLGYATLPMNLFPDTNRPVVAVVTQWPGAAANDVATDITHPAVIGAAWAMMLAGKHGCMPSFLGFILLMGIVVNNGILLVDFAKVGMNHGQNLREAILDAVRQGMCPSDPNRTHKIKLR